MEALAKLLKGYREFHRRYLSKEFEDYRRGAALRQSPKIMVISCSDSRVAPSIITHAGLGEIFHVANVANVVPPYRPAKNSHHSTSAAIEYAVTILNVKHIVILGHSNCGGIQALLNGLPAREPGPEYSFIEHWVDILSGAASRVAHLPPGERQHGCEKEALKISLANLRSFPWVQRNEEAGNLRIHAWHFDIESGALKAYQEHGDFFAPVDHE